MAQETKHLPSESSTREQIATLEETKQSLTQNINKMRAALRTKASTAKILANLHECPCLVKCNHEIQNTNYSNIDSLYLAKHEYAKTKLIDEFG